LARIWPACALKIQYRAMAGKEATAPGGAATIKFGTSGWRAIIADEFTFANVRRVVAAIAGHVLARNKKPTLIIGHDTRFFSEEFSRAAADVLRARGVGVLLCDAPAPTPAIAYEILRRKTDGPSTSPPATTPPSITA
jgi:Phosphomannomutase